MTQSESRPRIATNNEEIEEQIRQMQAERARNRAAAGDIVALGTEVSATFDTHLYAATSDIDQNQYVQSIEVSDTIVADNDYEELEQDEDEGPELRPRLATYSAPKELLNELPSTEDSHASADLFPRVASRRIAERETEYQSRRLNRYLSPERIDHFNSSQDKEARTFSEVMHEQAIDREQQEVMRKVKEQKQKEALNQFESLSETPRNHVWNDLGETPKSSWDEREEKSSHKRNRWDETPQPDRASNTSSVWEQTPLSSGTVLLNETPGKRARSRWDETPVGVDLSQTPLPGSSSAMLMTPNTMASVDVRNQPLSDTELDSLLPSDGYIILQPPTGYQPILTPSRKLLATPTHSQGGLSTADGKLSMDVHVSDPQGDLPFVNPSDFQFFGKLLDNKSDEDMTLEEAKERKIMRLLLKIKNGTGPIRKSALRQISDYARELGAGPLFNQILPLLMSPTLEDQERHLLVKVIDRIMYKLDDLVRPFVHKILVVIEPMLIDEDYYARVEGREIISNLSKAAGLATMISTMRPDIDHPDEYVRNTTARAFSVVASALGIPALLPFLKAVCKSKKSWQARHTGVKIVQQIAILMGCAVLPHLNGLVDCIAHGLDDEQLKVRTITALSVAALAEAAAPYGIESFDPVLKLLWTGINHHRGKPLAAFLKAIGFIIPLMDAQYANYYTREVMGTLLREFSSPDEAMKKIVLTVVKQCTATDGVQPQYIRAEILPEFFRHFWTRRMAMDRRNYKLLVDTTSCLAERVGAAEVIHRIVGDLKDESEMYRKMVTETIEKVVSSLGTMEIDSRLEERLVDGLLFAFQEQLLDDPTLLNGIGTVVNALGLRIKPYLPQISSTVLWRLNNKSAKVRQLAAELIARIAGVMMKCGEDKLLGHLGVILYEYLGEEYPDVLGSILGALKAIVNVIGMERMQPPIKDLLPRLTPILRNRHEKVQENCIDLVGRIADRGAESVSAKEWMRICFELLDMLKTRVKGIRRAAINTFGYIAKAIGPHDVLVTLLSNLRVQDRTNRVCTTVAIAIVAETCSPFTVLPALMNEYRVPEMNVQNGVLKSLSFMFEYIGEMGKDYVYAVTPLLEDALIDRDLVHRQTACTAVKHLALGVAGFGIEDAMLHLLNHVWPNMFETSPHVSNAVMEAIEGLRYALGPGIVLNYSLQGLFHPARRVRNVYWKIYNSMYVASQDALVAYYPRLNEYRCAELDLFV